MSKNQLLFIGAVILVVLGLMFSWWAKINWFEAGAPLASKYSEVDAAMRLKVQGTDLRVYEFTPQTNPNVQCVFVAGENKGGTFCFKKRANINE